MTNPQPAPMNETPNTLFPPHAVCVCGCPGSAHEVVWDGDEFKGTRCKDHGGHKFAHNVTAPNPQPAQGDGELLDLKKGMAVVKKVIEENVEWLKEMAKK